MRHLIVIDRCAGRGMISYQTDLKRHLVNYKVHNLGIREAGVFRNTGRKYQHLLPSNLWYLNLLESIRSEFQDYLHDHHKVHLHPDFHHLNSSQALTFNLFFPYLSASRETRLMIAEVLGVNGDIQKWYFEYIPDEEEGTNVDVAWQNSRSTWVFCEVKLSESGFGSAKLDSNHKKKLDKIYFPQLKGLVDEQLLEFHEFCKHYQLLRQIYLLKHMQIAMWSS